MAAQSAPPPYISVIIATRDRAQELDNISLPALVRQDTRDFEVVVWDASQGDRSEQVVHRFAAEHPDLTVRYFRAPRVGSCAQRNDAVKEALGTIVFFIDDDSEISPDGVSALSQCFRDNPEVGGGGLPLTLRQSPDTPKTNRKPLTWYLIKYYAPLFALRPWGFRSKMLVSGSWCDSHDKPGEVDHLMGCCMAFRTDLIKQTQFNEEMERIAPYALYEDVECTHRFWRRGHVMRIVKDGYVIHHKAAGQRTRSQKLYYEIQIYNRYLVWKLAIFPFNRLSLIPFIWSCIGEFGFKLIQFCHHPSKRMDLIIGTVKGYGLMLKDLVLSSCAYRRRYPPTDI